METMRALPVRAIDDALLPSAAELVADAFHHNPAHVYLLPDPATRRAKLVWLLGGNLRLQRGRWRSFCLAEGAAVRAMGFWTRSTDPAPGLLPQIREGILAAPWRMGWSGLRRLGEVTAGIDRHLEEALGERPYWYLNNMVVDASLRGSGIGTTLLREQLRLLREADPGARFALSTQRPENVTFYGRLGFSVLREGRIGRGPGAFVNWVMGCGPGG